MSKAAGKCTKRPPYSRLGWGVGDFRTSVSVIIIAWPGSELAAATGTSALRLQIAKAMGTTVIATSSSDEKLKRVRALGADHTINYRNDADWGARVREWTHGSGVDHVIEVGGPGTLAQSITAVAASDGAHSSNRGDRH